MATALMFTCIITPFEVGIMRSDLPPAHPLWWVNRVVDAIFVLDIAINTRLMYYGASPAMVQHMTCL